MTTHQPTSRASDSTHPAADEKSAGMGLNARLNTLRAAVLGANDGIVSIAGLVFGVAGATAERAPILTAGVAGLFAGALSMGGGEYVSVSTQRDTEDAILTEEKRKLAADPEGQLEELAQVYIDKGISSEISHQVARELSAQDALGAHAEAKHAIDPDDLTSPWQAAIASVVAFTGGGLLPLLAMVLPPAQWRLPVTMVGVLIALALTGLVSARLGSAPVVPAVRRNLLVGSLAMAITFGVGSLIGASL